MKKTILNINKQITEIINQSKATKKLMKTMTTYPMIIIILPGLTIRITMPGNNNDIRITILIIIIQ